MKNLAIVPARGGSKGIPKKNIKLLGEYPLIAYTIIAAKLSKKIDRVIVSTDSEEIAEVSKKYGAEVPFLRPAEISGDKSDDIEFFKHALDWLEKNENYTPDLIIHLRPTTPLRDHKIIDNAITEIINDKNATALRSAHIFENTGYKLFKLKDNYIEFFGREDFNGKEYYNLPRQSLPITYIPNGYVDIILPKILKETGLLHGNKIRAFITEKIPDIDTYKDLEYTKKLLKEEKWIEIMKKLEVIKNE